MSISGLASRTVSLHTNSTFIHNAKQTGVQSNYIFYGIPLQSELFVLGSTSNTNEVTCMAALVNHEDVRPDADHAADVALELPIWKSGSAGGHALSMG